MRLDILDYDNAMNDFIGIVIRGFIGFNPLLGQIEHSNSVHAGPIRNVQGENPLDQKLNSIEASYVINISAIRNTDFDEITNYLYTLAMNMQDSLTKYFFKSMGEITDATGLAFNAKGAPLSLDLIINMLEKMSLEFDDNGEPIMPTLIVPPTTIEHMRKLEETSDQKKRFNEMITKKREEYFANKRTRRLS
ncbi:MAG: hypothetical protein A2X25_02755 [Chloroflexi bacterium GWB2_49_20]|nr:MAG: hypothetical protein A2X25_02755 [Chloroflexi bacterium GWB2_49_20]OGN78774.1 MAG: hypothetical protein A2X26_13025 [Chloroflexi bacterium GWC2_49_37]OGN85856.1 MAG: hypothetical protein A2X27_11660 [Chloroflexi bacterium GWD2_49_16]